MSAFRPNRIADPEVLKNLSRDNLLRLLKPHKDFLEQAHSSLPPADRRQDESSEYSFHHLAAALLDTTHPPPKALALALHFIHYCATDEGEEAIEAVLTDKAKEEKVEDDTYMPKGHSSHADMALHAWLLDSEILESIYPLLRMSELKSSMRYPAKAPKISQPKLDRVPALMASLDHWYQKKKRRCEGTTIRHRLDEDGWHHFAIKRPDSYSRLGIMGKKDPEEFGFPERFDLVMIRREPAEMIVVARPKGIREHYRQVFAEYLYDDAKLFEGTEKYTLAPLLQPITVNFSGRPGTSLEEIKLTQTHHTFGKGRSVTHQDPDIIEGMNREKGKIRIPKFAPKRAKFALFFDGAVDKKGVSKPVLLEIEPPHTCRYSRPCDTDAVDSWLEEEGFIVEQADP